MFKPGQSGNPNGRAKGASTKATLEFKEAVSKLLDYATPNMVVWMEKIAAEDPNKALDHVYKFAQFGFPLLARQDVNQRFVNKDGEDLTSEDFKIVEQYNNKITGA